MKNLDKSLLLFVTVIVIKRMFSLLFDNIFFIIKVTKKT